MLTVEKIGGASMSRFSEVLRDIVIGSRAKTEYYNRIFVVSAYKDVTNWLLEHKKTGEPGIYKLFEDGEDFAKPLHDVLNRLLQINRELEQCGLNLQTADSFITNRERQAQNYLTSMADVLASGYVNHSNILHAAREILASIGEAHSAFNSVDILNQQGIHATLVDLCGFNDSRPLTLDERIADGISGIDFSKTIPVVTGYAKGIEGIMREFDRGYSEVTFSKIAVAVRASEAVIHKEFHLSSADPVLVGTDNSRPIGFTNFDVADQLADVGMEAIHPKASKPLELAGIDLRIKNTFEPQHPGTLVSSEYVCPEPRVEIITGTDKVVVVEIRDPSMAGQVGFDLNIMRILEKHQISYNLKSTSANSISFVVWDSPRSEILVNELRETYCRLRVEKVAMVCVIGSNIGSPAVLASAVNTLATASISIHCISLSLSKVNLQLIVNRTDYSRAIILLNETFLSNIFKSTSKNS